MRAQHSRLCVWNMNMISFSFVLIPACELLAQLTIHEMGIKTAGFLGQENFIERASTLWCPIIVTSLIHAHIVRVPLFKYLGFSQQATMFIFLVEAFVLLWNSTNYFKVYKPVLLRFPRRYHTPQSNKYLINQSRIFSSVILFLIFKVIYIDSREHQNINHSVITSYSLLVCKLTWWLTTLYFRISWERPIDLISLRLFIPHAFKNSLKCQGMPKASFIKGQKTLAKTFPSESFNEKSIHVTPNWKQQWATIWKVFKFNITFSVYFYDAINCSCSALKSKLFS